MIKLATEKKSIRKNKVSQVDSYLIYCEFAKKTLLKILIY